LFDDAPVVPRGLNIFYGESFPSVKTLGYSQLKDAKHLLCTSHLLVVGRACAAKESRYWLRLIEAPDPGVDGERESLVQEAQELMNIFGSIVRKSE